MSLPGPADPDCRRRPVRANSALVRRVLDRAADAGATWAPMFLGIEHDEERLSWLPGTMVTGWHEDLARLEALTRAVRQLHDLTVGMVPDAECVVHDDLQPRNVVVDRDGRIGIIDWEQARPGRRIEDVAQLCWSFVPPDGDNVAELGQRWRRILDAYGLDDRSGVVVAAVVKLRRCIEDIVRGAARGSDRHESLLARGDHLALQGTHDWLVQHHDELTHTIS